MTVKDNQPQLLADVALFFNRPPGPGQDLRVVEFPPEKRHGRLTQRRLWATSDVKGYLDWPGVEQALCVERRVIQLSSGEIHTERVYGLTSLTATDLNLNCVLERWRGHWSIENREHWVRDVVFAEDACRVHLNDVPHVLACLRNTVISLAHLSGFTSVTAATRHFALNFAETLAIVCGP